MNIVRSPYKEKKIADISPIDGRVRVLAVVLEVSDVDLVIADETGQISCLINDPSLLLNVKPGDLVRVFGFPFNAGGGIKLQVDIIQNMKGMNVHLYREVQQEITRLEGRLKW